MKKSLDVCIPVTFWLIYEDSSTAVFFRFRTPTFASDCFRLLIALPYFCSSVGLFQTECKTGDITVLRRKTPLMVCQKTSVEESTGVITIYTLLLGFDLSSYCSHDCHCYCLMASDHGIPPCRTCSLVSPLPY